MTPPIAPPRQVIRIDDSVHTAPTLPNQRNPMLPPQPEEPTVTTKEQEELRRLQEEHPGAPAWGLSILVQGKQTKDAVGRLEKRADDHEKRLGVLERPMRPRAASLSGMHEDDVAESLRSLSPEEQNVVVAKGIVRSRRQTNTQTGILVTALIGLATAGGAWLNAQAERTRNETAKEAAKAAAEAVQNAPPKMLPVPIPIPSGAY